MQYFTPPHLLLFLNLLSLPPHFFTFFFLFFLPLLSIFPHLPSPCSLLPPQSLHLPSSFSEQLLTSPLRVCELLGLNDFLLPSPVSSAPFDQANEIENFHLSQIDFKPETARPNYPPPSTLKTKEKKHKKRENVRPLS